MRIQVYIIIALMSAISWGLAFDGTRAVYHGAQEAQLIPNLHVKKRLRSLPSKLIRYPYFLAKRHMSEPALRHAL